MSDYLLRDAAQKDAHPADNARSGADREHQPAHSHQPTYAAGVQALAPGNQKGPIDRELDKKEHELTKLARKVRQMGVRVREKRNRATGRMEWRCQGKVFNHQTFGKFAQGVLKGDGKSVTVKQLSLMATRYAEWVALNYIIPKPEQIAKDGFPKPWFKGDPDPKWDPLIMVGQDLSFWSDVASKMGWLLVVASGAEFVGLLAYGGATAAGVALSGLNLGQRLAMKGLKTKGVFEAKISKGDVHSLQHSYILSLLRRTDILHRYFNTKESGVSHEARQGVAEILRATSK